MSTGHCTLSVDESTGLVYYNVEWRVCAVLATRDFLPSNGGSHFLAVVRIGYSSIIGEGHQSLLVWVSNDWLR